MSKLLVKLIKEVWNENIREQGKKLQIKAPKLTLEETSNGKYIAISKYTYTYETRFGFDKRITGVEKCEEVAIYLTELNNALKNILGSFGVMIYSNIAKEFVKYILLHELRHVWQTYYEQEKMIADTENRESIVSSLFQEENCYDSLIEKDADNYAISLLHPAMKDLVSIIRNKPIFTRDNPLLEYGKYYIALTKAMYGLEKVKATVSTLVGIVIFVTIAKKRLLSRKML